MRKRPTHCLAWQSGCFGFTNDIVIVFAWEKRRARRRSTRLGAGTLERCGNTGTSLASINRRIHAPLTAAAQHASIAQREKNNLSRRRTSERVEGATFCRATICHAAIYHSARTPITVRELIHVIFWTRRNWHRVTRSLSKPCNRYGKSFGKGRRA
jgi:hypothetical protein